MGNQIEIATRAGPLSNGENRSRRDWVCGGRSALRKPERSALRGKGAQLTEWQLRGFREAEGPGHPRQGAVDVASGGPLGAAGVAVEADERCRARDGHRPVTLVTVAPVDGNDSAAATVRAAAIAVQRRARASTASRPGGNSKSASATVPSAERDSFRIEASAPPSRLGNWRMTASPSGRKTRNRGAWTCARVP